MRGIYGKVVRLVKNCIYAKWSMTMKKAILTLLLALPSLHALAALEVIQLHYRSVEEVLPIVRPLLDSDGAVSGMNSQLILRSSAANIAEIKQMLQSIDAAPRRLNITVMQNVDSETISRLTQLSGSVSAGRARISVAGSPGGTDNKGLTVAAGQGADQVQARIASTRALGNDNKTQQIQVLEGKQALVSVGQSVAVPQRQVVQSPWQTQVIESSQYRDVNSGFYVLPRVNGDRVTLEISAQNDALDSSGHAAIPAMRTQKVLTTVYGRLGEWIVLGGTAQQTADDSSTLSSHGTSGMQERRNVLLKVDEIN